MAEFGEQLRKAREEKGLTQQSLADKVYVTRQTISRWESGSRYPDIISLKKLSSVLEVSTDTLLSNEEMVKAVDKLPVIEKKNIANNLIIFLYAITSFLIILCAIVEFKHRDFTHSSEIEVIFYSLFSVLKRGIEVLVFSYGLYSAINESYTSKKIGITTTTYFALEGMSSLGLIVLTSGLYPASYRIVISLPSIIGAVASYQYFIKGRSDKKYTKMIYFASIFGILRQLYVTINMHYYAPDFVNFAYLLMEICTIFIYIAFVYQTYVLSIRRKNAQDVYLEK